MECCIMKKYTAFIAACLVAFQANAAEPAKTAANKESRPAKAEPAKTKTEQYVSVRVSALKEKNPLKASIYSPSDDENPWWAWKWKSDKDIFGGSFAYGVKHGAIRSEIELKMQENVDNSAVLFESLMNASFKNKSIFLNAYYDFHNSSKFTPYIGAGIGYTRMETSFGIVNEDMASLYKKKKNNLSWNAGFGVSYAVSDTSSVDLGYRYIRFGTNKINYLYLDSDPDCPAYEIGILKAKSTANEIYLGYRFAF